MIIISFYLFAMNYPLSIFQNTIMPEGMHFENDWYISFCDACRPQILDELKDGIILNNIMSKSACVTSSSVTHRQTYRRIEDISGWLADDGCVWKLTNDSRREIIKILKAGIFNT